MTKKIKSQCLKGKAHFRDSTGKCIYCGDEEDYQKIEREAMGQVKKNWVHEDLYLRGIE